MSLTQGYDYDVAILGAGSAGYAAARTVAAAGLRAVVLEGGEHVGGLCILRGCMPTKALLYAAEVLHLMKQGPTWGLLASQVGFDLSRVMARKDQQIREFAEFRRQQLNNGKFKFIRAAGQFLDDHNLALSNGDRLSAKYLLIGTGSVPATPALPHLEELGYLTSDSALSLTKLPKSLIVLGGGPVAVEFAQLFCRLNVKVTLIQRSEHILRHFDPDAAAVVEKVFRREGMTVFTDTKLKEAWREGSMKGISFLHQGQTVRVAAEEILYALGRAPNTAGLALDKAGVFVENGRILANTEMQTTANHIYAAGDCTGPYEIVHVAIQQGETAAYNIIHRGKKKSMDYRLLCQVVFTDPQVATVGLTEREAKTQNIAFRAASYPFDDHGKSLIMEAKDGFVKLLACPHTGVILGGCVVGPQGGELIHEIVVAMHKQMTVHELARTPHFHPTLAEIWTYPAEELADQITIRAASSRKKAA
jgi:pyruvate/2-oxoglutarate dehydrogenase complex dihydrolipoamide dehydrogenase (E3) component